MSDQPMPASAADEGGEPDDPTTKAVSRWPALIHAWRKARDAIGRPDLRWHDLRHTAVALAIANGAHLKAIQSAWVMPQ